MSQDPSSAKPFPEPSDDDLAALAARSPALRRIIEEVKRDQTSGVHAYNRVYTRHNRS